MRSKEAQEEQYEEKRELVFQEYAKCLDLEVAMEIVPLSPAEAERLLADEELLARVTVCLAKMKSTLVTKLVALSDSDNESIRRSAVTDLGEMLYPKRFRKSLNLTADRPIPIQIIDDVPASTPK